MTTIEELLQALASSEASDLHISAGDPPCLRFRGELSPMADVDQMLDGRTIESMIFSLLTQEQNSRLQSEKELDFSFGLPNIGRFRANVHKQKGTFAASFHKVPSRIPSIAELGLPIAVKTMALRDSGLVLVTGPAGSGKSLTLAAMIETINEEKACHIITVEDPIEYVFKRKQALIKQREVGNDTESISNALSHIFRQDPDVIMIGEMRDRESIRIALSAAGTGRLVLGTMNTSDARSTIDTVIESFPADQHSLVRNQIAGSLEGIVSQQLLPRSDGGGRVLASEVLVTTPSIRNLIRTAKTFQIQTDIEVGKRFGMQSMEHSLEKLVREGIVKLEDAVSRTRSPEALIQRAGIPS